MYFYLYTLFWGCQTEDLGHFSQNDISFDTTIVSGGYFMMGCLPNDDACTSDEKPRHKVTISHDMEVMTTEVTEGLYWSVMGKDSHFPYKKVRVDHPVPQISFSRAVSFSNALNRSVGLEECYTIQVSDVNWRDSDVNWSKEECTGWRLPTEAEFEYLARGGENHLYSGSNDVDDVAWYIENSGIWFISSFRGFKAVGQKKPNAFGLFDMSGNLSEWTWDWYGDYSIDSEADPRGPLNGSNRVIRGGNFDSADGLRTSDRTNGDPKYGRRDLGIRFLRIRKPTL